MLAIVSVIDAMEASPVTLEEESRYDGIVDAPYPGPNEDVVALGSLPARRSRSDSLRSVILKAGL
jgi:hypothetical protein